MFYADLHLHSSYSRATSKEANLEQYYNWARIKGIQVISAADFTHPEWLKILKDSLSEDGSGLLALKQPPPALVDTEPIPIRFCLTTEISLIYKEKGRTRKVHHVVLVPRLADAEKFSKKLAAVGNITSDGRPILGITSRELLSLVKDTSADSHLIPAHVWTPWFSLFGSNSGYDDIEECFGDLTGCIFALETGLSSDPAMNWRWSRLDRYRLVSHSDAHSPAKLGREAVVFDTGLDYYQMMDALRGKNNGYLGTVEFFPEEGKYHFDGHRKCGVVMNPAETDRQDDICPVCGKKLTIGVMHRVVELADRTLPQKPAGSPGFRYFVPLPEIVGQVLGVAPSSQKVQQRYFQLIRQLGNEFSLIEKLPLEQISRVDPYIARAVDNIRQDKVLPRAGYDGEFGTITVLKPQDMAELAGQKQMFVLPEAGALKNKGRTGPLKGKRKQKEGDLSLSPEQQAIVKARAGSIAVYAGPGSGKTRVLVQRILALLEKGVPARDLLVLSFTNRAVEEMKGRLVRETANLPVINTFHAFCLSVLKSVYPQRIRLVHERERELLLLQRFPQMPAKDIKGLVKTIEQAGETAGHQALKHYRRYLEEVQAFDVGLIIDDFIGLDGAGRLDAIKERYRYIFVDEFQDINLPQYNLLCLFKATCSFFIIGDPDQSIYAWRGARPDLLERFARETQAQRYELTVNYRSQPGIIQAARALIRHNPGRHLAIKAVLGRSAAVEYMRPGSAAEEARLIRARIDELIGGSQMHLASSEVVAPSEVAILYRTAVVGQPVRACLADTGLPLEVRGEHLLENAAHRILVPLLTQLAGPDKLSYLVLLKDMGVLNEKQMRDAFKQNDWKTAVARPDVVFNIDHLIRNLVGSPVARALDTLAEEFASYLSGQEGAVHHLAGMAASFGTDIHGFLEHVGSNPYVVTGSLKPQGLVLSTFHGVKGLEFDTVFIIQANEGITPSIYNENTEEERRLFYVAMTRARKRLILSAPLKTGHPDGRITGEASRFIGELGAHVKEQQVRKPRQLSLF